MKFKPALLTALNAALYILPAVFLVAAYVFMTVTAEDILQGAGLGGSPLYGILWAFNYNSRLSDMYAYAVITSFDYEYSFGVDTVFRLIDAAMAFALIYLIVYAALGRRPCLRHGAAFAAAFLEVYLCPYCDSLLLAFSHIHNYLIIGLSFLALALPFALELQGRETPRHPAFAALSLALGFIFGFSSNITPAAFMLTGVIFAAYCFFAEKKKPPLWMWTAGVGIVIAAVIMYVVGSGVSHYASGGYSELTDYIPLSAIFSSPVWVARHLVENIRTMSPCLAPMALSLAIEAASARGKDAGGVRFSAACFLFALIHTIAMTQIYIRPLLRLAMPVYFTALVSVGFTAGRLIRGGTIKRFVPAAGAALLLLVAAATVDMAVFRAEYNRSASAVLESIRTAGGSEVEIPRRSLEVPASPVFGFTQFPLIQDWTLGQSIYGKKVILTDG